MSGFKVYGATSSENKSDLPQVDWNAMNEYIVETCGLQTKKTLIGVISAIVDLGLQSLPNSEYDLQVDDIGLSESELKEKYQENVKAFENFNPTSKFVKGETPSFTFNEVYDNKLKRKVLKKIVPEKARQCVAFAIDFPSRMLNKGQFFGDEEAVEKPLRVWYGGSFYNRFIGEKGASVIQNLTPIKIIKDDKLGFTVNPKNLIYKLAVATEVINETQAFNAEDLDKLLGKSASFEVSVGFNFDKKDKTKKYLFEKVKLAGAVMEGMPKPELDKTSLIMFDAENNAEDLKELRVHVKNTIKQALNYDDSKIKGQLESLYTKSEVDGDNSADVDEPKSEPKKESSPEPDDNIPF